MVAALASAAGEQANTARPGGMAKAFCVPASNTSMPSCIEFNLRRGHRTDRIHDEHHVRIFFLERGDFGQRAHHAGGGFVVNERERVELAGGKFRIDLLGADGRAPIHLQAFGLLCRSACETSSHLSENAPHMQFRTFLATRLRIAPSITPQAEEVLR